MSYTVDDFLIVYSPAVRELARALRVLIRHVLPKAIEQVDLPSNMISYGFDRSYGGLICGIMPQHAHVSVMFANGAALPDAQGLLDGAGKRACYVTIKLPADIEDPALQGLLTAAAAGQQ